MVSAYARGTVDLIVQRIVDAMMAVPGLAIFIAVLGFNLSGDALRDVLEPRLMRTRPEVSHTSAVSSARDSTWVPHAARAWGLRGP